ncbi:glycine cleavage system protein H [Desulfacinum hydrothermale]|uniref:glycine cleavage system protein H n=1 Tax=Desulfacinum hydrothermale TaxID=109258 RepID=UPI001BAF2363|nr:glycine cleavage system protein H [Desulfacinum hydrothermale]
MARKYCNNHYDCHSCAFDKAMARKAQSSSNTNRDPAGETRTERILWPQRMQEKTWGQRRCRHTLSGRSTWRLCPYNYECFRCPYDQMLEDALEVAVPAPTGSVEGVEGYAVALDRFYHVGHTWVRVEDGGRVRVGLDDFAYRVFGTPDCFNLPLTGESLRASHAGFQFRRGSDQADVLAPITGTVRALNTRAAEKPFAARRDPYGDGWLMVVEPDNVRKDAKTLKDGDGVLGWIQQEHEMLLQLLNPGAPTYPDGGAVNDVVGHCTGVSWKDLQSAFLRT